MATGTSVKSTLATVAVIAGLLALASTFGEGKPETDLPPKPANCETNDTQECILLEVQFEPPLRQGRDVHVVATVEGQNVVNVWPTSSSFTKYINIPKGARVTLTAVQFTGNTLKCLIYKDGHVKSRDSSDGANDLGVTCLYMLG